MCAMTKTWFVAGVLSLILNFLGNGPMARVATRIKPGMTRGEHCNLQCSMAFQLARTVLLNRNINRLRRNTSVYASASPSAWNNASMQVSGPISFITFEAGTAQRTMTRKVVTDVQLVAGGPALSGAFQLIRLLISAAGYSDDGLDVYAQGYIFVPYDGFEGPGDLPLPSSAVQVLGQPVAPTTNGYVGEMYAVVPAGGVLDLPVKITGTNSSNDSFNITPSPGLTIVDGNSGQDLTLQTNTVIVGQQMNLLCKTVTTNGPVLSNFKWTVPGYAISNYVVAADTNSAIVVTNFSVE